MNKLLAIAVGISLALSGFAAFAVNAGPQGPQGADVKSIVGPAGQNGVDGADGSNGINGTTLGSVTGPDAYFQTETHNGVVYHFNRVGLRSASTSLAQIKSPSASSTLVSATCLITGGNTYANDYQIGWGFNTNATTTNIARFSLAANLTGAAIATTTLVNSFGGGVDGTIPPNTFINFNVSTTTASATFVPTGNCSVTFRGL